MGFFPDVPVDAAFADPPAAFRGAPFWAWNGHLDPDTLTEQLVVFRAMGFGGFHIHARIGLDTEYLGEEFLRLVRECTERGEGLGLSTWLYDEDKWPSGFGGGRVAEDPALRARYLLLSPFRHPDGPFERKIPARSRLTKNGTLAYRCSFLLEREGSRLRSYRKVPADTEGDVWHAYEVVTGPTPWCNNSGYADLLDPKAVERFIQVTHEVYARAVGDRFGSSIRTMFTDEPQFPRYETLREGSTRSEEVGIPFSRALDAAYRNRYGTSLLDLLPELCWMPADGGISRAKLRYHDLLADQFSRSYAGTLSAWCTAHRLALTGHLMGESSLDLQSRTVGEAMRSYPFFGLPGIDMLAKRREYLTVKQAESCVRQEGKPGLLAEVYGVTNWDFDFRGHKTEGDWLAALGVTVRVPHLSWLTMAGEAKRDYPAPIDQHSPWWSEYPAIENHFARVNLAMTRGRNLTHIAVIHPIESYWALLGPDDDTALRRDVMERRCAFLCRTLLRNLLDFDYLSEASIPRLYDGRDGFGASRYKIILVPGLLTIRSTTLAMLASFQHHGGTVVFLGPVPAWVDGVRSDAAKAVVRRTCAFDVQEILDALEEVREVDVRDASFLRRTDLVHQLREDGRERWLFLAHGWIRDRNERTNFRSAEDGTVTVTVKGSWRAVWYRTMEGAKETVETVRKGGTTAITLPFFEQDSILLRLSPAEGKGPEPKRPAPSPTIALMRIRRPDGFRLAEPNVLLLDQAAYTLDDGPWHEREEILKLDDRIRDSLGWARRSEAHPQPWLVPPGAGAGHQVVLRFRFRSTVAVPVSLAQEMREAAVRFNGTTVHAGEDGYYVDRCLPVLPIGTTRRGWNTLETAVPFGEKTNLEWCFLLGDFSVRREGTEAVLAPPVRHLSFGDLTREGFPFYGGNLRYRCRIKAPRGRWLLHVPHYAGALIKVWLDGRCAGRIILEPYVLDLGVREGPHTLDLELFGTRYDTFGQMHDTNPYEAYWGPKTWRTEGDSWTYGYRLKPFGILDEPLLEVREA